MQKFYNGFTLISSILILLTVTSMMALMLSLTTQTVQQTSNIYLSQQAKLLAKSATEYALLAVSGHDRKTYNDCINHINSTYSPKKNRVFDINITIRYIGLGDISKCNTLPNASIIKTKGSIGTVIIDTFIRANINFTGSKNPLISYHRRTIQKL